MFKFIFLVSCLAVTSAFTFLKASTAGPNEDALNALRAKVEANPNYNPYTDPEAIQLIDSMIPDKMREVANAVERVKVAFKDAAASPNPITDYNSLASVMSMKEALSTPQSKWFKEGFPKENPPFNKATRDSLLSEMKQKYPESPK